jgi:outer membrane protein assembly factor BamB
MQCLKNSLFRLYSPILAALLGSSILLFALAACGGNPVNVGCTGVIPPQPSLHVVNGVAYFGDGNAVYALRASDGTQLWHFTIDGNTALSAVDNGIIYVGSASSFYALQASNGKQLWHFQGNGDPDSRFGPQPVVADGVVYITSRVSTYAVRASDGKQLWHSPVGGLDAPLVSPLAVGNGMVYIGTGDAVVALRASDGKQLWSYQGRASVSTDGEGTVYVNSQNSLYALRAADSTQLWHFQSNVAATSQFDTQPLVVNGVVYVNAGSVTYALRARDGTSLWKTQTELPDGTFLEAEQGIIYVSSNGTVAALQASNGALLWNVNVAYGEPRVVVNGIILSSQAFGGCSDPIGAEIFATRANHGKALWSFQI